VKRIFFLFIIIILPLLTDCKDDADNPPIEIEIGFPADKDKEFDQGSAVSFPELNGQLTDNLELLGRIWGFLKYHHPEVGKGNYNWDYELFRVLPEYLRATNNTERDRILLDWINKYGEIPACKTCRETNPNAYIKPDHLWIENGAMNNTLKAKLKDIYQNRHQGKHFYILMDENYHYNEFIHERDYSNIIFPDAGFDLLALYRYWNIIYYFSPYKYLTDKNWDDILSEYIPLILTVENRLEYELTITQLITETNDTHAIFFSGRSQLEELKGNKYPPFQTRFVEGKLVVSLYYNPELQATSGLEIGDIITHINGEKVESMVSKLMKYYPASNEAAKLLYISSDLLRSNQNNITIQYNSMGQADQKEIHLFDRYMLNIHSMNDGWNKLDKNEKCYKFLEGNIGYVTLANIIDEDITAIKESFINSKGIIIDIRNYPSSKTAPSILSSFFVSESKEFSFLFGGNRDNPGEFSYLPFRNIIHYDGGKSYEEKLIVLIDEITFSAAEYAAMCFRAGLNTTIIGSTTAGAVGKNPTIVLPGGITTTMTGLGTRFSDGTETQRIGIVPDVWVEPTIEGIRQGRDELLEMAIKLINEE